MKKILVVTDFSQAAQNAAQYAANMAAAIDARLYLLHVYQIVIPYGEIPVLAASSDIAVAEESMKTIREQLIASNDDKLIIESEVRTGIFFDELKTACEYVNPYVVVMGSQGTSASEHLLFGSHAVHAMKYLSWPLITVPPGAQFMSIKKIGLACDFRHVMDTVPVDEIRLLLKDFNAELHVLNTGRKDKFDAEVVFESGIFRNITKELIPQYHFVNSEDIDDGIIALAEKYNIDMLIVLPQRHNLIDKLIHRSHTKQLVLHSPVPVMALHQ